MKLHIVAKQLFLFLRHYNKMREYLLPQMKFAMVVFLHRSVTLFPGGGGFPACITGLMTRGICIHGGVASRVFASGCGGGGVGRPSWDTMGYGQRAGSTHPTGMHSCLICV